MRFDPKHILVTSLFLAVAIVVPVSLDKSNGLGPLDRNF